MATRLFIQHYFFRKHRSLTLALHKIHARGLCLELYAQALALDFLPKGQGSAVHIQNPVYPNIAASCSCIFYVKNSACRIGNDRNAAQITRVFAGRNALLTVEYVVEQGPVFGRVGVGSLLVKLMCQRAPTAVLL